MSEKCEHGRDVWACLQCADDRRSLAPWSVVEDARRERDAAIERAEKAEAVAKYATAKSEDTARHWELRAIAAEAWKADERARFERETAARLLAGFVTRDPMPKDAFERAASGAAIAADHYFGAKEAKG